MNINTNSQEKNLDLQLFDPSNPFFSEFDTPKGTPPFDLIKTEHYLPAFLSGIEHQQKEIYDIAFNVKPPTFENTILALEESGQLLSRVETVFYAMLYAQSDTSLQRIATELSPKLSEHSDNILLNEVLFNRIKNVYEKQINRDELTTEQKTLTEKYYKRFVRSGIMLDENNKNRLREINKELSILSLKFGENLLAETYNYELVIDNPSDLSGLPADVVESAAETARSKGYSNKWVFTLSKTSWLPFLQYADNRALREKLYKAMYNRCNNGNEYDNNDNIIKIVNLRLEKANLLGYKSHAGYVLEETMAETPENVFNLLNTLWEYALPQAEKEKSELQQLTDREGGNFKIESWDWWYYAEKLRKEKYDFDDELLKPYFTIDNVRDGAFLVANKLYGINFKKSENIAGYTKNTDAYEITDSDGSFIGIIYLDFFSRPGKQNGAWMGNFRDQAVYKGKKVYPIVYNVANFPAPGTDNPSMLTPEQVTTLFHEFGHGLHGLLSECTYKSLSGTSVYRDFVELPSQIFEHWALHPDVLKLYAKHYRTGETIPEQLVGKLQNASKFNLGFETTELVAAAILDMKWHTIEEPVVSDAATFENHAMDEIGLIPEIIVRYKSPYFAHIFNGGYSSGYYSYLWSEVLDADAFHVFEENGIFDKKTAESFRYNILSKGGTEHPGILYKHFRGKEPDPVYLLKNRGFIN